MESEHLVFIFAFVILIIAGIFYYLLDRFFKEENARREYKLQKSYQKNIMPQKWHAYERVALFLERIKPTSLGQRVSADGSKSQYELALLQNIQTEYEHNLSQQIYVNPETWKIIYSTKNATQNYIRECSIAVGEEGTAADLQEEIIRRSAKEGSPSAKAMLYLQKDIQGI